MPERLKQLFDTETHPLVKGFVGMIGTAVSWTAGKATWIEPTVKAIGFYGGAIVVLLTITSLSFDVYRKWKKRKD